MTRAQRQQNGWWEEKPRMGRHGRPSAIEASFREGQRKVARPLTSGSKRPVCVHRRSKRHEVFAGEDEHGEYILTCTGPFDECPYCVKGKVVLPGGNPWLDTIPCTRCGGTGLFTAGGN